jgi:vancomycin resistance protein YoaR
MEARTWFERPAVRWSIVGVVVLLGLHLAAAITLGSLQQSHAGEVLRNVEVDGRAVGGATRDELERLVGDRADERLAQRVHVTAGDEDLEVDRATVGAGADVEDAVEQAWARGRRGLWRALLDHVRVRRGSILDVPLRTTVDDDRLDRWSEAAAEELSRTVRDADLAFVVEDDDEADDGAEVEVEVVEPRSGQHVGSADLRRRIAAELDEPGPVVVEVPVEPAEPEVTQEDLDATLPDARLAISAPVTLTNPSAGEDLVLMPPDLARVLAVERDPGAPAGERLAIGSSVDRLVDHLGEGTIDGLEADPVDARFVVEGESVRIEGGTHGYSFDAEATSQRIVELATRADPREDELPGDLEPPDRTRQDAEELGIEEQVSSFTTSLVPGQARNTNIQLGGEILDGSLIHPGERFSLNEAIGPRTRERGFVENGFIDEDGELGTAVGGGSSQIGTTFLNAAWFAGIQIHEFQPHSLYFHRYPMGREATLSYGTIDVVVENDSPYGILIAVESSESAFTVRFFSTRWAQVETTTSEPFDVVEGEVRDGFDVTFSRTIIYPDGERVTEEYAHRYRPEDEPDG